MGFTVQIDKAMLQEPRKIAADGKYPAKQQVHVIAETCDFYVSSETVNLMSFPVLEPVSIIANVTRMGGGKGFFVLSVDACECKPVLSSSKK